MPQSARNDREVLAMLRSPIAKAINYVIDKIYDENIGAIHDVVYMAYSPEEYERTGDFYGQDARPYLAELIYNGATGSLFGDGAFRKKRDAWEELNKRIGRRKMKQWMKEGLEAAGLKVQMHNKAIEATTTKVD